MKKLSRSSCLVAAALSIIFGLIATQLAPAGEKKQANSQMYGISASDKVGFHGTAPTAQRAATPAGTVVPTASATVSPASVATTAATSTSPFGYSEAQANAIVAQANLNTAKINQLVADNVALTALVHELRTSLVAKGLIKGGP
jgi:hypothetical protein